jgi:hypothetical protein
MAYRTSGSIHVVSINPVVQSSLRPLTLCSSGIVSRLDALRISQTCRKLAVLIISLPELDAAFRGSKWFTRGWTLQELIAPSSVEFFSLEGEQFGDRTSLERQVHEITGIPVQALRGSPLSEFTVEERKSWAARRITRREEDEAYCLLGIFDIFMPLLYGEGREKALMRLQETIDKPLSSSFLFS